jgi:ubiquinone/menaquinone biosynthesis C-methylase UbiE
MSFDLLAPYYPGMEMVLAGGKLHRCRTAFLDQIPPPSKILLPGEGHGRTLLECCRRFPWAHITYVDASQGMLAQARGQLARQQLPAGQVEFILADLTTWTPPAKTYDLIITHFVLDCFRPEELAQLIPRLATAATPKATWLLADFQIPPAGLPRLRSRLIIWSLYVFFRIVARLPAHQLTPPDPYLQRAGFTRHRRIESEWGLLHSDWWAGPDQSTGS